MSQRSRHSGTNTGGKPVYYRKPHREGGTYREQQALLTLFRRYGLEPGQATGGSSRFRRRGHGHEPTAEISFVNTPLTSEFVGELPELGAAGEAALASDPVGWAIGAGVIGGTLVGELIAPSSTASNEGALLAEAEERIVNQGAMLRGQAAASRSIAGVVRGLFHKLGQEFKYLYHTHLPQMRGQIESNVGKYVNQVNGAVSEAVNQLHSSVNSLSNFAHNHIHTITHTLIPNAEHNAAAEAGAAQAAAEGAARAGDEAATLHMEQGFQKVLAILSGVLESVGRIEGSDLPAIRAREGRLEAETHTALPAKIEAALSAAGALVSQAESRAAGLVANAERNAAQLVVQAQHGAEVEILEAKTLELREARRLEAEAQSKVQAAEQHAGALVQTAERQATHEVETAKEQAQKARQQMEGQLRGQITTSVNQAEQLAHSEVVDIGTAVAGLTGIVGTLIKAKEDCTDPMCKQFHKLENFLKRLTELGAEGLVIGLVTEILQHRQLFAEFIVGSTRDAAGPILDLVNKTIAL